MLPHKTLKLGDHLGVAAQREVGINAGLHSGQAHLFQARCLRGAKQRVLEIRIGRSTPQPQRLTQHLRSDIVRARGRGLAGSRHQISEPERIHLIASRTEHVPGPAPRDEGALGRPAIRLQHFAHPDGIHLHRLRGAGWRLRPPQRLEDVIDRNHAVGARQQQPKKPPLLDPLDRELLAIGPHLKRPEHTEPH